jgi:hypothetical protein
VAAAAQQQRQQQCSSGSSSAAATVVQQQQLELGARRPRAREGEAEEVRVKALWCFVKTRERAEAHGKGVDARLRCMVATATIHRIRGERRDGRSGTPFWAPSGPILDMNLKAKLEPT